MALKIRLARGGTKKRPFYRVVVADSRSPRDGRFIERLGSYNPMVAKDHPDRVKLKDERIKYWLSVGASPTDRVARFLGAGGIIEMPAIPEQTKQNLPRPKTLERRQAAEEAAKAAAEAPKAKVPETPAPEAVPEKTEAPEVTETPETAPDDAAATVETAEAEQEKADTEPEEQAAATESETGEAKTEAAGDAAETTEAGDAEGTPTKG